MTKNSEIQNAVLEIETRIAKLREMLVGNEPVAIKYGENIDFEIRSKNDDDRILVGRDGWGYSILNYTTQGLILDVISEDGIDSIHTASVCAEDLQGAGVAA